MKALLPDGRGRLPSYGQIFPPTSKPWYLGFCLARQCQPCGDRLRRLNPYGGRAIHSSTTTATPLPTTRLLFVPGLPATRALWLSGVSTTCVLSDESLRAVSGQGWGRRRGGLRRWIRPTLPAKANVWRCAGWEQIRAFRPSSYLVTEWRHSGRGSAAGLSTRAGADQRVTTPVPPHGRGLPDHWAIRHHHHRDAAKISLPDAWEEEGASLRRRRRPRRLHLVGQRAHQPHERMAGLGPAEGNDRASALPAPVHGWGRDEPARGARDVSGRYWIPHPRYQSAVNYRQFRVFRLHSLDQWGCRGPLQAGDGGHPRNCAVEREYGDLAIAADT